MKKKKWYIMVTALVIFILFFLLSPNKLISDTRQEIYRMLVGEPIDFETGEINNRYFNIDDTGNRVTTSNINEAIAYANKNNIEYIKLKKGTYKVNGIGNYKQKKGIIIKSNMEIDFNGSIIVHEKNGEPTYSVLCIFGENNVKISNGILVGDRENHNYEGSTHEWGMGIEVRFANNIEIYNFEIYNMTGDGIYVTDVEDDSGKIYGSENIKIENCNIHHCRRQGISVICAKDVEIRNNEIHDIVGALPANGIDLEANKNTEIIDNIKIYENKFYNLGGRAAIEIFRGVFNVDIYENEMNGDILCFDGKDNIYIHDNIMNNGRIYFYTDDFLQSIDCYNKNAIIESNKLYNSYMDINDVENIKVKDNYIEEGYMIINSCNAEIFSNQIYNQEKRKFAYQFKAQRKEKNYKIVIQNNKAIGEFETIEDIQESENFLVKK